MSSEYRPGLLETLWGLLVSFFLILGAVSGLFFISWGRENVLAVVGGALLATGCGLGLVSRWKKELETLDALFGHQAKASGMSFAYWVKRRLDRLNSYLVRIASAVVIASAVAVLWSPGFWLLRIIVLAAIPEVSSLAIVLLEGLSHPVFGVLVGILAGYGYYKSRRLGSHFRLD